MVLENLKKSWKKSWKVMEFEELKRVWTLCNMINRLLTRPQLFWRWREQSEYPLDKSLWSIIQRIAQLVSLILVHWIVIYPVDSTIQLLNNQGQAYWVRWLDIGQVSKSRHRHRYHLFRHWSLPVSLLQKRVLIEHPVSVLYEVITVLVFDGFKWLYIQAGTVCLAAIYHLVVN